MEKTLKVLNLLEKEGLIQRYAIGGAIAALFYSEPSLTYDMDVFVLLPRTAGKRISLSPLYNDLKKKGYREEKEHVAIEGIPVQFLPAYGALVEEALQEAKEVDYQGVKTRVLQAEHLAAIMLKTGRPKDKAKLAIFLEQAKMDTKKLTEILKRHSLTERWESFRK